jgi:hypothetical protein
MPTIFTSNHYYNLLDTIFYVFMCSHYYNLLDIIFYVSMRTFTNTIISLKLSYFEVSLHVIIIILFFI